MSKSILYTGVAVVLAIAVVAYFFFIMNPSGIVQNLVPQDNSSSGTSQTSDSSVVTQEVTVGTGTEALPGDEVSVNYVGKLQDGTVFDQSSDHGGLFQFTLGAGQVIPGWDQGIQGMKVGGERILVIPPSLGYGSQAVGPIPANSTLIFDVTLVDVSSSTPPSSQPVGAEGAAAN